MWFITALFLLRIIMWLFLKLNKKYSSNIFINIIIAFLIAGVGIKLGHLIHMPWSFDIALVALYFGYIGYEFKQHSFFDKKTIPIIIINSVCLIVWILDFKYSGLSMNNREYFIPILSLNGAVCASVIIIWLSKLLDKINIKFLNVFLSYCGINSLIILIFHTCVYFSVNWALLFTLRLLISITIIEIINLIPLTRKIFGSKSFLDVCKEIYR